VKVEPSEPRRVETGGRVWQFRYNDETNALEPRRVVRCWNAN
jgi:hypothetical protein